MPPALECRLCHYRIKTTKEPATVKQMVNLLTATKVHEAAAGHVNNQEEEPISHWNYYPETPKTPAFNSKDVVVING
ncbi:MAG: hypothetical protein M1575_02895 [Patescibacteria group bacterium]|nr:hypothetical protein [Patescibacteria group bacterium]MCL5095652.1 hypothetical protein [Patescibacteria group bacterium]